jgi:1,4-alpha-glucan branching enzyme
MNAIVPVTFRFPARHTPAAQTVSVVGSFNNWDPAAHPLHRTADGDWTVTVYLSPCRVVYLFFVDGVTWLDPADDNRIANGWGSEYSVRQIVMEAGGGAGPRRRTA